MKRAVLPILFLTTGVVFGIALAVAVYASGIVNRERAGAAGVSQWRKRAKEEFQNGDMRAARSATERVLSQEALDGAARSTLGRIYARSASAEDPGPLYRAISEHKLALTAHPHLPDLYYNIACYYARLGALDQSFAWLSRAFDRGFGRLGLLESDPDMELVRSDARYRIVRDTGRLPEMEPTATAHLQPERVGVGEPFQLVIDLIVAVPDADVTSMAPPAVQFAPGDPFRIVRRTTDRKAQSAHGWTQLHIKDVYELRTDADGLHAVPPAVVEWAGRSLSTDALVLTVDPRGQGNDGESRPPG